MKSAATALVFWTLNIKFNFLPSPNLLVIMGITIVLDFVTGIIKAKLSNQARTSEGYRKTVIKFTQYGGSVLVGCLLKYVGSKQSDMTNINQYIDYLNNGLLIFIVFIETTSILENIYAIDKETPFSKYLISPLLKLLTFQIKNNPIEKLAEKQSDNETTN
jgi:hypothetical protein